MKKVSLFQPNGFPPGVGDGVFPGVGDGVFPGVGVFSSGRSTMRCMLLA